MADQTTSTKKNSTKAKKRRKQTRMYAGFIIGLFIFLGVAYLGSVLRDYHIDTSSGSIQFVANISVPNARTLTLDNAIEGKIIAHTTDLSNVDGYEFQLASNKHMLFGKVYGSATAKKEFALLKSGKTYYVRVRAYVRNDAGRKVHGRWSVIKGSTVKGD